MTQEPKIIRAKLGLLELAKQLGNVSQACIERILSMAGSTWCRSAVNFSFLLCVTTIRMRSSACGTRSGFSNCEDQSIRALTGSMAVAMPRS